MSSSTLPVALVTGGTRGIGRAICNVLSPTHHVLVGGRSRAATDAVAAGLASAAGFVADLRDEAAIAAALEPVERLDVVVHSAGVADGGTVADTPAQLWRDVFEINVVAVATVTRLALGRLRAARGQVITINSGAGFRSGADGGVYSASKFALRALTDALREEERGVVRVTSIHPGRVDTDMQVELQRRAGHPYQPERYLRPESVAAAVRFAVDATDEAMIEELSIRPIARG